MTAAAAGIATVIVLGPIPPPINGYSVVTAHMVACLGAATRIEAIDLAPDRAGPRWHYHIERFRRASMALLKLLLARPATPHRTLYLAVSGGAGVVYDLGIVVVARLCRYRIFLHHHAFTYIDRACGWMAALVAAAGRAATHICLCPTMAERLRARYRGVTNTAILSNAAFFAPAPLPRMLGAFPFRIGFLSNLSLEKGLDTVLEVFRALHARQLDVRLAIAGPVVDSHAQALLDDALGEFGEAVEYRGAAYGESKVDFFRTLDLFLFPTRYPNEAEPLVLLEALAAGVPVIATGRGCIADDLVGDASIVIPAERFVTTAVPIIADWLADRAHAMKRSEAARGRATELHRAARRQLDALLASIILTEEPAERTNT